MRLSRGLGLNGCIVFRDVPDYQNTPGHSLGLVSRFGAANKGILVYLRSGCIYLSP